MKRSIVKPVEPCDCCQRTRALVAYNGYRVCEECKVGHKTAMAQIRQFPRPTCLMGEKCDCVHNRGGCQSRGLLEVIENMACLQVCWTYKQKRMNNWGP